MDCLEGQRKVAGNFEKVKLEQQNIKDASLVVISSEKTPQRLFALFVKCLMTGDLYRTVPPKMSNTKVIS